MCYKEALIYGSASAEQLKELSELLVFNGFMPNDTLEKTERLEFLQKHIADREAAIKDVASRITRGSKRKRAKELNKDVFEIRCALVENETQRLSKKTLIDDLLPYEHMSMQFTDVADTRFVKMSLGLIRSERVFDLTALAPKYPDCNIMIMFSERTYKRLGTKRGEDELVLVYLAGLDGYDELYAEATEIGFKECEHKFDESPARLIAALREEIEELLIEYRALVAAANQSLPFILARQTELIEEYLSEEILCSAIKHNGFIALSGKIPEEAFNRIKKQAEGLALAFEEVKEGVMAEPKSELTNIIKSIEDSAREEAERIIAAAKSGIAEEIDEVLASQQKETAERIAQAERESSERIAATIDSANRERQAKSVAERAEITKQVYSAALKTLAEKPIKDYIQLIVKILYQHAQDNDVVIIGKNESRITERLIVDAGERFGKRLTLSNKREDFTAGIKLRRGAEVADFSFDGTLEALKPSLQRELERILFS